MITDMLLAQIKATTALTLTDTCTIAQRSQTTDEYGSPVEVYETLSSGTACRVITMGNRFKEAATSEGMKETITDSYRLILPAGTVITVDCKVTLSGGDVYHVVDLVANRTQETDVQVIVVKAR